MINITINSKKTVVQKNIDISTLLKEKNLDNNSVVVLKNSKIIKKDKLEDEMIEEGDELEILRFVGGG